MNTQAQAKKKTTKNEPKKTISVSISTWKKLSYLRTEWVKESFEEVILELLKLAGLDK